MLTVPLATLNSLQVLWDTDLPGPRGNWAGLEVDRDNGANIIIFCVFRDYMQTVYAYYLKISILSDLESPPAKVPKKRALDSHSVHDAMFSTRPVSQCVDNAVR